MQSMALDIEETVLTAKTDLEEAGCLGSSCVADTATPSVSDPVVSDSIDPFEYTTNDPSLPITD